MGKIRLIVEGIEFVFYGVDIPGSRVAKYP